MFLTNVTFGMWRVGLGLGDDGGVRAAPGPAVGEACLRAAVPVCGLVAPSARLALRAIAPILTLVGEGELPRGSAVTLLLAATLRGEAVRGCFSNVSPWTGTCPEAIRCRSDDNSSPSAACVPLPAAASFRKAPKAAAHSSAALPAAGRWFSLGSAWAVRLALDDVAMDIAADACVPEL